MSIKLKTIFSKTGDMRYISHLDLMRLFQRASRRAELPITVTQGFSPHLKLSITKALKLGIESTGEEAMFYLDHDLAPGEFLERLNTKLPEGVKILQAERIN